jgi:hypothetical protein
LDKITKAIDNDKFAVGIFIDFAKAFDTVNHTILLQKVHHYGIRGIAHKWLSSYITNIKQFCTYNGFKSSQQNISCGVPQGSILGPLLFLIYVNDLGDIFTKINAVLFADDTNLIVTGNSIKEVEKIAHDEMPLLITWLNTNRLSLNVKKTNVMIFGKHRNKNVNIKINNTQLEIVQKTTFLGLILDSQLNWKLHLEKITKKVAKVIGIISRAKQLLNKKTLIQLYFSFAYPYLIYGNLLWGSMPASTLWPLFKIQKILICIIGNIRGRDSTQNEFKKLKILRLPEIFQYSASIFMYNYENKKLPPCFNNLFNYNRDIHSHNTRNQNRIRQPRIKTKMAERFITNMGPKIWNELEGIFDRETSIKIFKKNMIEMLMENYG